MSTPQRGAPPRQQPAKLEALDDDQLAQVVAWLFSGRTYRDIVRAVKKQFGLECSRMAVRTIWLRYAERDREMREERIIKRARLLLQRGNDAAN